MLGNIGKFAACVGLLVLAACAPTPAPVPPPTAPPSPAPLASATPSPTATSVPSVTRPPSATTTPTQTSTRLPTATRTPSLTATPAVAATDVPRPPANMTRFQVSNTKNPNAVCNDGSTAIFYLQRGSGSGTNKWIVFLQGGGACRDTATCAARERSQVSSTVWTDRDVDRDGILSGLPADNPDFYSWNHVFLPYCSSDFWSGASLDNHNPMNYYFRGHAIVDGVVDALSDGDIVGTPTLNQAAQIIFAGSSAGGIGVRVNLDYLAKKLSRVDVRGVMDAIMFVGTNPAFTQEEQDQSGQAMMNLYQPVLDESCQAASAARPWLCVGYAFAVTNQQIATPLFVRHDLYDPVNLEWEALDPKSQQDRQAITATAMLYSDILHALPGAFGTATSDHIAAASDRFNTDKVDGLTFAQVLGNWYFNRPGPKVVVAPVRR